MIIRVGTMYSHVDFEGNSLLREQVHDMVHRKVEQGGMGVMQEGAFFSRAYKSGYWDGIIDFYDFKEDKFHTGLLQQFLDSLRKLQNKYPSLTYEIKDERPSPLVHPDSIDEEIILGTEDDPIKLRDYQYSSVKKIFEEQIGIINVATNGGKTLLSSGFVQQILPYLDRGERVAFFTHSTEILYQSLESYAKALNMSEKDFGIIGDGKFNFKNKQIVFVMIPTLVSSLKDPKKGVRFNHNESVIKFIATEVAPKFRNTANTRQLLRNYIKNCQLTTKIWKSAEEQLMYIAYDNKFTDRKAQMQLNKYIVEFDKILEKKNKKKYKRYKDTLDFLESVRVVIADECLVGETLVMTPDGGWKYIREIKDNDEIIGGRVSNVFTRKSPITSVLSRHTLIEGSPTHPTFVVKAKDYELYKSGKRFVDSFETTPLMKVKEGDYIPVLAKIPHSTKYSWTPEQLSLVAMIMADGHLDKDGLDSDGRVKISNRVKVNVPKDQEWYLDEFTKGVKSFSEDIEVRYSYDCRGNLTVSTVDKEFKSILENIFDIPRGKKSDRIRINEQIQYAPLESIKAFIRSYFSCEGDVSVEFGGDRRKNPSYRISANTASKEFALGMSLLLRKFGIIPNLQVIRKNKNRSTIYRLTLAGSMYNIYMDEIGVMDRKNTQGRNRGITPPVYVGDYILSKVRTIEHFEDEQDVYDFTTTSHTFIANGALTHNCHHAKSDTWYTSLSLCNNAQYRIGLTGTVDNKDKMGWQRLQALFGGVIAKVSNEFLIDRGVSSTPTVLYVPIQEPRGIELIDSYLEAYEKGITNNEYRNNVIAQLAKGYIDRKPGGVMISVNHIEHGENIKELLDKYNISSAFLQGELSTEERRDVLTKFDNGEVEVLIGTSIIDEGLSLNSIGCMILAAGGKSMRQQLQRIGRGLRLNGIDGNKVVVFDFYDMTNEHLKRHSNERIRIFKNENFDVKIAGE